jgi:hypothetical protein
MDSVVQRSGDKGTTILRTAKENNRLTAMAFFNAYNMLPSVPFLVHG